MMALRPHLLRLGLLLLAGCATMPQQAESQLEVREDCGEAPGCFESIQAAVEAARALPPETPVHIRVGAGDFMEKVTIRRGNLTLAGAGRGQTRLHHNLVAEYARQYHRDGWGTAGSATLTIDGDRVTVRDMTVENTFDYLGNRALPEGDPNKVSNSQALAVLLDIHSDRVLLDDVALLGYQDTLFANGKRAYVRDSFISGNVDFIFGNGQLLIEGSELQSRRRTGPKGDGPFESYILAPSTPISQPIGIVVYRSKLTREAGVPDGSVALARPWHPTTTFPDGRYADPNAIGQALFIDTYMDAHINEEGWTSMSGTARDGTKTDIFKPQDSRFWESGSYGPGARRTPIGITWEPSLSIEEIRRSFFENWSPEV